VAKNLAASSVVAVSPSAFALQVSSHSKSHSDFRAIKKRLVNDAVAFFCQRQEFLSLTGGRIGVQRNVKPDVLEANGHILRDAQGDIQFIVGGGPTHFNIVMLTDSSTERCALFSSLAI
jgi:hypothetical protein